MFKIQKSIEWTDKPTFLQYSTAQGNERERKIQFGDILHPVFSQRIGTGDSVSFLELLDVGEKSVKLVSETTNYQVYKYSEENHCIEEHKLCYLPHQLSVSLQQNDDLGVFVFSSSALFFKRYGRAGTDLSIGYLPNIDENENNILYCNLILEKTKSNPAYTMYTVSAAGDLAAVIRRQVELALSIDIVSISKSIDLDGKHALKGNVMKHFEIEIPLFLESYTYCELVCDDQMLLLITSSKDEKKYSFIGISLQNCELEYCKSINITEQCIYLDPEYFILNGNNGIKDLLLFNVGDKERKIQMYSLGNNFKLLNEYKLDDIAFFKESDSLRFQVSNDVLFILSNYTHSIHVIECSRDRLYEKYRMMLLFDGSDDGVCDFSVGFNGFEAIVFSDRYVEDEEDEHHFEMHIDVYNIPKSSFSLYGLCRLAIKNMLKSKEVIESLPIPKKIKKELSYMI